MWVHKLPYKVRKKREFIPFCGNFSLIAICVTVRDCHALQVTISLLPTNYCFIRTQSDVASSLVQDKRIAASSCPFKPPTFLAGAMRKTPLPPPDLQPPSPKFEVASRVLLVAAVPDQRVVLTTLDMRSSTPSTRTPQSPSPP